MPCPTRYCATLDHWVVLFIFIYVFFIGFWMILNGKWRWHMWHSLSSTLRILMCSIFRCRRFPGYRVTWASGAKRQHSSHLSNISGVEFLNISQLAEDWTRYDQIDQISLCRLGGLGAFGVHESRTQDLIGLLVLTCMQKIVLSLVIPKPLSVAGEKPGLMPLQKLYIYINHYKS